MTHGAAYSWPEGRDVPDQWHAMFDYPGHKLAIASASAVHNGHAGRYVQLIGRDAAMEVGDNFCRVYGASWRPGYAAKRAKAPDGVVPPDYSMLPDELKVSTHMENFFDCIRSRELPRCPVDRAFEEAVTIVMSVEAYRKQRTVRWDARTEEIL
jgi:predicted dehydrogenase